MQNRRNVLGALLASYFLLVVSALSHEIGQLRNPRMPVPAAGESQCVVAVERDLPGGAKAEGKPGDYILRNHKATFVIAAPRLTSGYSRYGGRVLDAVLNEPGHDEDMLGEIFFASADERGLLSARVLRATRAEVVSSGGKGVAAHLRVHAVDDRFPIADSTLRVPSTPQGLSVAIDYILPPDSATLRVEITLTNSTQQTKTYSLFWGQILGDGLTVFIPPHGAVDYAMRVAGGPPLFGLAQTLQARTPLVAALGSRVSYGFLLQQGNIPQIVQVQQISLLGLGAPLPIEAGGRAQIKLALAVGDGTLEELLSEVRRLREEKETLSSLQAQVVIGRNQPVPGARVYLLSKDNGQLVTMTTTNRRGNFRVQVPAAAYRAVVFADGHTPVEADLSPPASITLQAPARLQFTVRDDAGKPLPCALVFERLEDASSGIDRARFGEQGDYGRFARVYYSLSGNETIPVEPGRYRITATRGFEYEIAQQEVQLRAGQRLTWRVALNRSAMLPGYLSGDFHVHALPSPDSNDPLADKVKAYIAMGVQILTSTDHDILTDYQPVIRALGVQQWITSVVGCEITPNFGLGHFNAYPQRYDPTKPNYGAIEWYDLNAAQIFTAARRNNDGDTIVQINHPRSGAGAYFSWVGLDPVAGTMSRAEEFSPDFDAIEVFNGIDANQLQQTLPDWFYFLNAGKRYIAIGNTDSHNAYRLEPGHPRTYLYFGHDNPQRVTPQGVVAAIRSGNVIVCGGPIVTMRAQGRYELGSTVPTDGMVELVIQIQAASWVRVNRLKLYVNGKEAQELSVEHPLGKPLNWQRRVPLKVERDSWVIALVEGEGFSALYPGARPVSFTNPIYLDVGGDGWKMGSN